MSSVFNVQVDYDKAIGSNELNRVQEFYKYYGEGNVKAGKEKVNEIVQTPTLGERLIESGGTKGEKPYTKKENKFHENQFFEYLQQGENINIQKGGAIE